jgi:glucokinase
VTVVAGVDIGGTKIEACLVDPVTGEVSARERIAARTELGGTSVLADCVELVERVRGHTAISAVGIGLCEFVSPDGRPTSAFTVDWRDLDVADAFRGIAPARIESDVRAGALAEARFGAASGVADPWLYVTIGTGVSFALVINGRPFAGARGNAIVVGAPPVELVASGLALQQRAGRPRAEDVITDPVFAPLVADAATALGRVLAALVNGLDPALIVVAGGLGLVASYRNAVVQTMRGAIEAQETRALPVVPAALGNLAGALGAALAGADWVESLDRAGLTAQPSGRADVSA